MGAGFIEALQNVASPSIVLDRGDTGPYMTSWHGLYQGSAVAVVAPRTTEDVAKVAALCSRYGVSIVPQGGNTGLCGGATPRTQDGSIVISTRRMNRIIDIDTSNNSMEVQAGCLLQDVQAAARNADRYFPLSFGSEGSCTIGGNLATNAGGSHVVRYGCARQLVLGLEVVTPGGKIFNGLTSLRKDNTGYDLRDLYIGSEGTLGIITRATLALHSQTKAVHTALIFVADIQSAVEKLVGLRAALGSSLSAAEFMSSACLGEVMRRFPDLRGLPDTVLRKSSWVLLVQMHGDDAREAGMAFFTEHIGDLLAGGDGSDDAIIAQSIAQANDFWALREGIPLLEASYPESVELDVSLPISKIPAYLAKTNAAIDAAFSGIRHFIFGHIGDGNVHYDMVPGAEWPAGRMTACAHAIADIAHGLACEMGGSVSAEHGIGQFKAGALEKYKDPTALELFGMIKAALDPQGIMNPGKILASGRAFPTRMPGS